MTNKSKSVKKATKRHCSCVHFGDALVVASLDALGTTQLPQLLHRAGLRVTILGKPGLAVNQSRFVHRSLRTSDDPAEILRALQHHLQATTPYCLVLLADDPLLWAAAQQKERSWMASWFPFPLADDLLACATSKIAFIQGAARLGLPVPRFHLWQTADEAQAAAKEFGYPLVLKLPYGLAGSAVHFVRDVDEVKRKAQEFGEQQTFLAQEFMPGDMGATPALFNHGRPVCWFSYLMRHPWPHRFAAASAIEITDHPDIAMLLEGVGALTSFHGLGAIDWVRDPQTGRLWLIELNPRPTPALMLGPSAGVDFSSALRDWLVDDCVVQRPQLPEENKRRHFLFPQSLYYALEHHSLTPFLAAWSAAPWNDPQLLLAHGRRVVTHFLPPRWKSWAKATSAAVWRGAPASVWKHKKLPTS